MGSHPLNLALRFLLELTALGAAGIWAWKQHDGWIRMLLAFGIPVLLAAIWVIFAVPDDPSRSGSAQVITPGIIRLIIELGIFAFATWCFYSLKWNSAGLIFAIIVALHYLLSYDRIGWLLSQ